MRKQNKKGFTIVELVIVIAVIAILVAVMVPTFVTLVRKAQVSNDRQLIKNLNTALTAESVTERPATMTRALEIADDYGYNITKINAKASGNQILWDELNNVFCYLEEGNAKPTYIPEAPEAKEVGANTYYYWKISKDLPDDASNKDYSIYYTGIATEVTTSKGFDAGTSAVTKVNYTTSSEQYVVIRTNNDQCVVNINVNNEKGDVNFHGFAKEVKAEKVPNSSLHIYGSITTLKIEAGHAQVEETGIVFDIARIGTLAEGTGATITNNGYIAKVSLEEHKPDANTSVPEAITAKVTEVVTGTKTIGGALEIGTLAQLESFRDTVNAGGDFAKLEVKLTADIKLNDGWKPIGEGARKVGKTGANATNERSFFSGTFDGQGHTISNLNNKGFVPRDERLVADKIGSQSKGIPEENVLTYAYGLFGLVGKGATIKNLKLTNVAIDTTTYAAAIGDSVGALIGYSHGSLTVENIEVSGYVKASDSVGGIIGRSNNAAGEPAGTGTGAFNYSVTNCVNNANVTIGTKFDQKGAGIVGFISIGSGTGTFTGNINNGTITGGATYTSGDAATYQANGSGNYVLQADFAVLSSSVSNLSYDTNVAEKTTTNVSSTYNLIKK